MIIDGKNYRIFDSLLPDARERDLLARLTILSVEEKGRQGTGYLKYDIKAQIYETHDLMRPYVDLMLQHLGVVDRHGAWDSFLLVYPRDSFIPPHRDACPIPGMRHVRMNAILHQPPSGGQFVLGGKIIHLEAGDAILFHPDEDEHEVYPCIGGQRVVLTVGAWVPR
jgi:hypothetical protein